MIWFLSGVGNVPTLLSGIGYVPTLNVRSNVWDHVESYAIRMFLACRLKFIPTFSLKLISSFLVSTTPSFYYLLLTATSSPVRASMPLPLLLCCITGLGQKGLLQTVLESGPHAWMPPYSHLTVYSSPRVTLVHLAANTIPLGLQVTEQEIPQELYVWVIALLCCFWASWSIFWVSLISNLRASMSSLDKFPSTQQPSGDP
jgi:hypothetical protein